MTVEEYLASLQPYRRSELGWPNNPEQWDELNRQLEDVFGALVGAYDVLPLVAQSTVLTGPQGPIGPQGPAGAPGSPWAPGPQSANVVYAGPTTGGAADPTFRALVTADIPAGLPYEASGAIATHAALTTGVHGLAITAGQTLTVTTGGTLGSAAYTAASAYDAAGAAAAVTPTTLGLVIGTNTQAWSAKLDAFAGLSDADSTFIVGSAAGWVAESGATARTSLGVGTGDSPQFTALTTTAVAALTTAAESWVGPSSTTGVYFKGGNIGIGTTSPGDLLALYATSGQAKFRVTSPDTASDAGATYQSDTAAILLSARGSTFAATRYGVSNANLAIFEAQSASGLVVGTNNATPVIFGTGLAERMRVSSGGNVGIGTTNPLAKLHVVETSTSSPRGILSSQYSTGTDGARIGLAKGRGTEASPTTVVTGDTLGRLIFRGHDGSNMLEMASIEAIATGTIAATRVPTALAFDTATDAAPSVLTERMRIDNAGNVGIGISPSVRFDVQGSANDYLARFTNAYANPTGASGLLISGTNANADMAYGANRSPSLVIQNTNGASNSYGTLAFMDAGGNTVAIINGILQDDANNQGALAFLTRPSGGSLTEAVRIASTGNVGIGTTAPTAVLHLKAGTATANTAPQKFTAGTLLTAPEIGALEFVDDGTTAHLYATVRVATVVTRVQIV